MLEKIESYGKRIGFSSDNIEYSYEDIVNIVLPVAESLDLEKSDEIAICMNHGIPYAVYVLAAIEAGRHVYLLHPNISRNTLEFLEKREVLIYTDDMSYEKLKEMYSEECLKKTNAVQIKNYADISSWKSKDFKANIILTTSGTTSDSAKYVCIPFQNIFLKSQMLTEYLQIREDDKTLLISPLCFVQSVWTLLIHLLKGGNVHFDTFKPQRFDEVLRKNEITTFITTPSVIRGVIKENKSSYSLRLLSIGGDYMDEELLHILREKWPDVCYANVYGATETCAADAVFLPRAFKEMDKTFYSLGKESRFSRIFIVDEEECILGPNQEGIICIQSPFLIDHYYQTVDLIRNEKGYFKTYDVGCLNEEGDLFYRGRASSIIVYNGQKISSYEIENLLYQIDGVKEVIVIGEKHELYGQVPVAYIVGDDNLNESMLYDFLSERLEKYKLPRKIVFTEKLIRTNSGKLIRKESVYES